MSALKRSPAARSREFARLKGRAMKTAVPTRRGNIFPAHKNYLTAWAAVL
jgi:hypothetical protein